MSKPYYTRGVPMVSRDEDTREAPESHRSDWFSEFAARLAKEAATPAARPTGKPEPSLYDQISQILGAQPKKTKYSSVEDAVSDMRRRTGLTELLAKQAQDASESGDTPELFTAVPDARVFIDNYIEDRPGTSVDACVAAMMRIPSIKSQLPDVDDVAEDVKRYINAKLSEQERLNPQPSLGQGIGKADVSKVDDASMARDNNPFGGCEPVKY